MSDGLASPVKQVGARASLYPQSLPRGVNVRQVFVEPRRFDLVLWVQGSAATPYLEEGPLSKPETWRRFQEVFRGEFIGFAIWFN